MIRIFKQLYLPSRFFWVGTASIVVFAVSFVVPSLFALGLTILIMLGVVSLADSLLLTSRRRKLTVQRIVPGLLSLGDENKIAIKVKNNSGLDIEIAIYDELPYQLQMRDFELNLWLKKDEEKILEYLITPTSRGNYVFGNINIMVTSVIGFVQQKQVFELKISVPVYPSIIQMKKFELKTHPFQSVSEGVKRHRRMGHSYEFDQIKEYVVGDDSRSINWKASSRKGALMVNQYEDERSQQVFSIVDKSRSMRMPFNNLTLLDYAINTSLVISNVVLQKHDKAGLITFSDKIGTILPAEKSTRQLKKILETLYNEQEHFLEADYELLYHLVRNVIKNRSLIFLYTNFESYHAFERILPILRQINKFHLLVVIFFDNEEVVEMSRKHANKLLDIYIQTMAGNYLFEKNQIVSELNNHGIHCIKTLPKDLSINTINKYLEFKSRRMI
ncbi:MAG TPA: DUF58 domain-containing protein [Bacteroidales bacterium]